MLLFVLKVAAIKKEFGPLKGPQKRSDARIDIGIYRRIYIYIYVYIAICMERAIYSKNTHKKIHIIYYICMFIFLKNISIYIYI